MSDKELEKIYNEAYRAVYWTALSLLKTEADAEDIVQDTFVTLIESYDTLNDKDKVIPWLKKIAANKCINRLTRTRTDIVENEFFDEVEAAAEDFLPDSIIESEEARKIVMDIINNKLSDDIRRKHHISIQQVSQLPPHIHRLKTRNCKWMRRCT